jgi:flagellar basal-body rod modification protein FlgD
MSISASDLNSILGVSSSSSSSSSSSTSSTTSLGEEDFLSLLVAQLKNQDPLDPMSNTEFVAQLAQFSSLEQMTSLNTSMTSLLEQQSYTNNASLLGKQVTTSDGTTGVVTKVTKEDSVMYLYIGDTQYSMSDIVSISNVTSDSTT